MGSELTATNFMLQRLEWHIKEDLPLLYLPVWTCEQAIV